MTKWTDSERQFLVTNYESMTTKEMAKALNRDYSTTKRQVKTYVLDVNDQSVPQGFKVIPSSPIHAINEQGTVIRLRTRKPIKQSVNNGYYQVCLQDKKTYRVHRLVATAFILNPEDKPQVNHIDGDKLNNHVSNLEWVTNDENREHAIANGLWSMIGEKVRKLQTGETNSSAKLREADVLDIYNKLKQNTPVGVIAKTYGVKHSNISVIKSGKSWKHLYHIFLEGSTTRA